MPLGTAELARLMMQRRTELADRITDDVTDELASYAGIDRTSVQDMAARAVDILIEAVGERRPLTAGDRAMLTEYGGLRAAQGVALEDVYQAWRRAVHTLIDALVELADSDRVALRLTRELLDRVDEATIAFTRGYHAADRERVRDDEQRRSRFVLDLLYGRLGSQEIKRGAAHHGLDTSSKFCALNARGSSESVDKELIERLTVAGAGRRPLVTTDGDALVGIVSPIDGLDRAEPVGLGPSVALADLPLSFRLASRARSAAEARGLTGLQGFEVLGLQLAVSGDPDVSDALIRAVIEPLGGAENAAVLVDTVRRYLDVGARVEPTAAALFVHPNTVRYRIARFQELAGLDLRRPHDAFRAWWAIEAAVLRDD